MIKQSQNNDISTEIFVFSRRKRMGFVVEHRLFPEIPNGGRGQIPRRSLRGYLCTHQDLQFALGE